MLMQIKQKDILLPRNLADVTSGVCNTSGKSVKSNFAIFPVCNGPRVLPSTSDKAKLLTKTF